MPDQRALDAMTNQMLKRGGAAELERMAREYVDRFPDEADGYSFMAAAFFFQKRFQKELMWLDAALERDKSNSGLFGMRGKCLYHLGRFAEAAANFEAGIRLYRDDDETVLPMERTYLAECYFRLGNDDRAEAVCRDIPDDFTLPGFRQLLNGSKHFILADIAARRGR